MDNNCDIMTVDETAEYLKLKVRRVYVLVQKKQIPYLKIGSSLRFRKSDLDNWFNEITNQPA